MVKISWITTVTVNATTAVLPENAKKLAAVAVKDRVAEVHAVAPLSLVRLRRLCLGRYGKSIAQSTFRRDSRASLASAPRVTYYRVDGTIVRWTGPSRTSETEDRTRRKMRESAVRERAAAEGGSRYGSVGLPGKLSGKGNRIRTAL